MSDVKDFGAVGDGRADDTDAIQRAIWEGDGVLAFPRGEFRITRTLEFDLARCGRVAVHGCGGVGRLAMDGPGPAIRIVGTHAGTAGPSTVSPGVWQSERMPTVSDLEIEGRHPEADGVLLEGTMQPILWGLLIREVNTAVRLHGRARNVLIDRCHIYHTRKAGIHLDRLNLHQVCISNSHISFCRLGGVRVEASEIRNLQITGNDIEYNNDRTHEPFCSGEEVADIFIDAREGRVREGTIVSNTIQATPSPGGASIRFLGRSPEENLDTGLFTITGNLIGSQERNIHVVSACNVSIVGNAIYASSDRNILVENSRNVAVGANTFDHPAYHSGRDFCAGLRMVDCANCNVTGVLMQDCREYAGPGETPPRKALLEFVRCRNLNVSATQALDGFPYGMYFEDCERALVSGCSVWDERESRPMLAGIVWKGGGKGSMIANCRVGVGEEGGIVAGDDVVQADNLVG